MEEKVRIRLVTGGNRELQEKLETLRGELSSGKIEFSEGGEAEVRPALIIEGPSKRMLYSLYPGGREWEPFLKNLVRVSSTRLDPNFRERIEAIEGPVVVKVLGTEFCPTCPKVIDRAGRLLSGNITLEVIDLLSVRGIDEKYEVTSTPTVIINERAKLEGEVKARELLEWVEKASQGMSEELFANLLEKGMLERATEIAEEEGGEGVLAGLIFSPKMRVRMGAIAALEELYSTSPHRVENSTPVILENLKGASENIKGDALYALGKIGGEELIEHLEEHSKESDGELKEAFEEALKDIKERSEDERGEY